MKKIYLLLATIAILAVTFYAGCRSILYNDYSNAMAVEYLTLHAKERSQNACALYVRRAIGAGGCPTFLQPPSACDYDMFLPDLGFVEVSEKGYAPEIGDIVVFSAINGHKHGHICMYNGTQWISDFKQRSMYSAAAYRSEGTHTYWRRHDGKAWRKVSIRSVLKYII